MSDKILPVGVVEVLLGVVYMILGPGVEDLGVGRPKSKLKHHIKAGRLKPKSKYPVRQNFTCGDGRPDETDPGDG